MTTKSKGMTKGLIILIGFLFTYSIGVWAASGDLDAGFGTGGTVVTALSPGKEDSIKALVIQPDGKLVAAGRAYDANTGLNKFALVRYQPDGAVDTAFGTNGTVTTAIGGLSSTAYALLRQTDGKLVAAGIANGFSLARYHANGALDVTFGTGGTVTTPIDTAAGVQSLVQQADGKLVAAGWTSSSSTRDVALVRYNSDGSIDTTFGTNGVVVTVISSTFGDQANAVVQQDDGKLVIAGSVCVYTQILCGQSDFVLIRYLADGALDTGFGAGGKVIASVSNTINASAGDIANALVLQHDGKLVAAGKAYPGQVAIAMMRFNTNGALDSSFGTGGIVTNVITSAGSSGNALAISPNGRLIVAGHSNNGTDQDFTVARYLDTGVLDTTFGTGGMRSTAIRSSNDQIAAIALQPDGKIVAAGHSNDGSTTSASGNDFALARYLDGDGDTDGVSDSVDAFPLDPAETLDTDHDGIGNNADPDDDNDGFPDNIDLNPLDPAINDYHFSLEGTYKGSTVSDHQGVQ